MNKKIKLLYLMMVALLMSGCVSSKEGVALKNETDMVDYATLKYGKAEYVSHDVTDNFIKYTLRDSEYKFNYECISKVEQVCVDGTCTGKYKETTLCNFDEFYKKYIIDSLKLKNQYTDFAQNYGCKTSCLFALNYENAEENEKNIGDVSAQFKQLDKRNYYADQNIAIYDNDNNYLGIYRIDSNKYINRYDEAINTITSAFAYEVNSNDSDLTGITYVRYERKKYQDIEKFDMIWLNNDMKSSQDLVTVYYFEYNNEEYFMLDEKVFINDKTVFGRVISDKYYTNYWYVKYN